MNPEKIQRMRDLLDFAKSFDSYPGYDIFILSSALELDYIVHGLYMAFKKDFDTPPGEDPNFNPVFMSLTEMRKLVAIYG